MGRLRTGLTLLALVLGLSSASSCDDFRPPPGEVVLYYSADDYVAQPIIDAFEEVSGLTVRALGDTEATKTTGLVQRLRAESSAPRADVYWSSEVFLTIQLAREGLFSPLRAPRSRDYPSRKLLEDGDLWRGFAQRARVVVFNTERVEASEAPQTMQDLLDPRWKGRIVMARPQFGTTRGHMAMLVEQWGPEATRGWLEGLAANDVRLLDGNSSVVRAVANGEALVGLTDTDDVWSGQRNGWPINLTYVQHDIDGRSIGPLLIPNTVAVVDGGPNPDAAQRLAAFLLSEAVERMLAESDSHNIPTSPSVAAEFSQYAVPGAAVVDYERIADAMDEAMRLCDEALGG
jgi:iron(III) transport system substrate-binding protein